MLFSRRTTAKATNAWQRLSICGAAKCNMNLEFGWYWCVDATIHYRHRHHRECSVIKNFRNTLKFSQAINLSRGAARAPFHLFLPNSNIIQTFISGLDFRCVHYIRFAKLTASGNAFMPAATFVRTPHTKIKSGYSGSDKDCPSRRSEIAKSAQ